MYLLFLMYINAFGFSQKEMFLENIVILMEVLVKRIGQNWIGWFGLNARFSR